MQQALQPLTGFIGAASGVAQVVVELQRQLTLRRLAGKRLPVQRHRFFQLAATGLSARLIQQVRVFTGLQGNGLLQLQGQWITGMGLLQLRQVIARAGHTLGLEFQQAQAV